MDFRAYSFQIDLSKLGSRSNAASPLTLSPSPFERDLRVIPAMSWYFHIWKKHVHTIPSKSVILPRSIYPQFFYPAFLMNQLASLWNLSRLSCIYAQIWATLNFSLLELKPDCFSACQSLRLVNPSKWFHSHYLIDCTDMNLVACDRRISGLQRLTTWFNRQVMYGQSMPETWNPIHVKFQQLVRLWSVE